MAVTSTMGAKVESLIDDMGKESVLVVRIERDSEPFELTREDGPTVDSTHLSWNWGIVSLASVASVYVCEGV